jgi:AcrR family transcriptional regulator
MPAADAAPGRGEGKVRPLRADARRNRARILEAADLVFAAEGMGVPIDEVARRAGVGVGTLYRHFPTKEALLEAILLSHMEGLLDEARARANAEDPGEALFGFLALLVERAGRKKNLADALGREGVDIEVTASPIGQALMHAVEELLVRAQRSGAVRTDVGMPELFGLVAGTCVAADRRYPGAGAPQRMLTIVCDGLRAGGGGALGVSAERR